MLTTEKNMETTIMGVCTEKGAHLVARLWDCALVAAA